ncbi:hypothetical protein [Streptomyces sp. NPDC059175]|uniref:hypothetical protein n=1 Tax=unclassified Streptomyces TaxID=2593676 RepID=UPI003695A798
MVARPFAGFVPAAEPAVDARPSRRFLRAAPADRIPPTADALPNQPNPPGSSAATGVDPGLPTHG